jgi:hypothetical protein
LVHVEIIGLQKTLKLVSFFLETQADKTASYSQMFQPANQKRSQVKKNGEKRAGRHSADNFI